MNLRVKKVAVDLGALTRLLARDERRHDGAMRIKPTCDVRHGYANFRGWSIGLPSSVFEIFEWPLVDSP